VNRYNWGWDDWFFAVFYSIILLIIIVSLINMALNGSQCGSKRLTVDGVVYVPESCS
jgi:hypothetical protein